MQSLALFAYALAVGLTLAGIAGTMLELAAGCRLGFRPPFVRPNHVGVSLALTMAAGPYMLVNEAVAAWRCGVIGRPGLGFCALTAGLWALASGILLVELALLGAALLG
jgi:hypothetical protein